MKIKILFLLVNLISSTQIWADTDRRCSEELENQLTERILANQLPEPNAYSPTLSSCMHVNIHQQPMLLFALSRPLEHTTEDNAGNYDLNIYLLDQQQKILQHYTAPEPIIPETRLNQIQWDINPYSSLANQPVFGLAIKQTHIGGISHDARYLNLYHLKPNLAIQPVLTDFLTDFSSGMAPHMGCDDAQTYTLKRILMLSDHRTHGFQDIIIKEKTEDTLVNTSNCKVSRPVHSKQHILKFDGKRYNDKTLKFLKYGI